MIKRVSITILIMQAIARHSYTPFKQKTEINFHTRGYTPGAIDSTPSVPPPPFKTGSSVSKPTKNDNNEKKE
jgi:hypothetical protein